MKMTDKSQIIKAYSKNLEPMSSIAKKFGVTRQAVYKLLTKAGVNTSKRQLKVLCSTCGNTILRHKHRIRKTKHHFCDLICLQAFQEAGASHLTPDYLKHGTPRARAIVSEYFDLKPGHVVHHEDNFPLNNQIWNLRVFGSQADHIKYHRGIQVTPLWNGIYV